MTKFTSLDASIKILPIKIENMTPKNPKLGKKFPLPVRRSQRTLNFAFIESFFTNAPPSMIVSMYQTIQTIYAPETIWMTKKNFESSR